MNVRGRKGWAWLLAMAPLPVWISGCTALHTEIGHPMDPTQLPSTASPVHYHDVLDAWGPPTRISACDAGLSFLYECATVQERQLGFNFQAKGLNLIKFSFGKGEADRQVLQLIFNDTGHLRAHRFRAWTDELGAGVAVQFMVAILSVVDTGDFDTPPFQHTWGAALLEPALSVGLNRQSSMETGMSGLELLGTPRGTGQHALEARPIDPDP